jgi:phage-related tail protein
MSTTASPAKTQEDSFKAKAQEMGEAARQFGDKAKDAAANVADKAKETAGNVADKAKDAASKMADKTRETASALGQKAEDATHAVGRGIGSLGGTVRENLPQSGVLGAAASSVASGLESTGQYLEKEGLQGMAEDLQNIVRRNPLPALLLGIGLGFIIARAIASRNS